jgi:transcriptional regulator with XRE-family HTH domain
MNRTEPNQTLGPFLRRERMAKKIGLREMARKIDMSPTYLSMIERGEYAPPAEEKVREIAKLIGCDEDELLALAGRVPSDLRDIIKERALEVGPFLREVFAVPLPTVPGYSVPLPDRSAEYDRTAEYRVENNVPLSTVPGYSAPRPKVDMSVPRTPGLVSDLTQILRQYPEELGALLRAVKGSPPNKWADIWREKCIPQKEE